ncbi:MAG: hypothetical protein ACOCR6_03610, partial [archaeon]
DVRTMNGDLSRGAVRGEDIRVVTVDFPDTVNVEDFQFQDISNLDGYITEDKTVGVTGGVTANVPAAAKFTGRRYPPGVVAVIDPSRVPVRLEQIEYDLEWFNDNPGVLAHVTTLRDAELREGGEIVALLDEKENKTTVGEPRQRSIENEATARRYTTEEERVAFGGEIPLNDSVVALVSYLGTEGTSPYTIKNSLIESPMYQSRSRGVRDVETREMVAESGEYRKHAELLYDAMVPMLPEDIPYYIVAVDSRNDVRPSNGRITPENFRWVYNGHGFDEDWGRNSRLLGGV